MPRLSSQINVGNFSITIPEGWEAENNGQILTIFRSENGVGAIQISSYSFEEDLEFNLFDEFHEMVAKSLTIIIEKDWAKNIKQINDEFLVLETGIVTENKYFVLGLCEHNKSILFLTYNCSLEDKDIEYDDVLNFFENIKTVDPANT